MCAITGLWWICPLVFFGIMILCMIFFRRRGGWTCYPAFNDRYSDNERIRRLEEETQRLKGDH